ncbi:MAG: fumarylacetoacetate hydrolase family protein [Bacteroidota bacterium]
MNIQQLARELDEAASQARPIGQLSQKTTFNVETAYDIQKESIAQRYERGEAFIGLKLGFTSEAKMKQMGVSDMIWGRLTDSMLIRDGKLRLDQYIHPRAEPEICFYTRKKIDRAISLEEAPEFIDAIAPAIEIIDSRYENFKFSLEDVIADNCSSAALVVGRWHSVDTDLSNLSMKLLFNGEEKAAGTSAAILGNPWRSVEAAARLAVQYGIHIPAGSYVLAGAATAAVYLEPDTEVKAVVDQLGETSFHTI